MLQQFMPLVKKQTKWRIHSFTTFLVIIAKTIRSVKYIQREELGKNIYYPSKGIWILEEGQERVNSFPSSHLPSIPCLCEYWVPLRLRYWCWHWGYNDQISHVETPFSPSPQAYQNLHSCCHVWGSGISALSNERCFDQGFP